MHCKGRVTAPWLHLSATMKQFVQRPYASLMLCVMAVINPQPAPALSLRSSKVRLHRWHEPFFRVYGWQKRKSCSPREPQWNPFQLSWLGARIPSSLAEIAQNYGALWLLFKGFEGTVRWQTFSAKLKKYAYTFSRSFVIIFQRNTRPIGGKTDHNIGTGAIIPWDSGKFPEFFAHLTDYGF